MIMEFFLNLVPEAGLEPARYFYRGILSPLCLPIPPLGHLLGIDNLKIILLKMRLCFNEFIIHRLL